MQSTKAINCSYTYTENTLTLKNSLISHTVSNIETVADSEIWDSNGLALPCLQINARKNGANVSYRIWDDIPIVYTTENDESELIKLKGDHWVIKTVKLLAFTDDNDTLTDEQEQHLYKGRLFRPCVGEIFILEDIESENAILIVSDAPDHQKSTLTIQRFSVSLDNGKNGVAIGFCKSGECESLCREYYRHARAPKELIAMSNTWGDRNGFSRVCQEFVMREIDAGSEIGVDIVQIDDGWQSGNTADPAIVDPDGMRNFNTDFWNVNNSRFTDMRAITDYAGNKGIKIGLWFAPDSHDNYALLERDISVLKKAYDEWGARFFKIDMFWIRNSVERDRFLSLLDAVYSFGDDAAVQLDVTRNYRTNYLCGKQYGTVFVENRYAKLGYAYPHRILRNLWMISKYVPTSKFQFEIINPDLGKEAYPENDPFVPCLHDMDYLFATVMLSNPLFWMEMQFLSQERKEQLSKIIPIWKQYRNELSSCDVLPIGDKPNGRSFTGFCVSDHGEVKYLLLFRQSTGKNEYTFTAPVSEKETTVLATNTDVSVKLSNGSINVKLNKQLSYAFIKIQ